MRISLDPFIDIRHRTVSYTYDPFNLHTHAGVRGSVIRNCPHSKLNLLCGQSIYESQLQAAGYVVWLCQTSGYAGLSLLVETCITHLSWRAKMPLVEDLSSQRDTPTLFLVVVQTSWPRSRAEVNTDMGMRPAQLRVRPSHPAFIACS